MDSLNLTRTLNASHNTTAIILCGGLGTRLQKVNIRLPKAMVRVAERPFLEYILDYLLKQGVNKVILAVSYKKEAIMAHFGESYKNLAIAYSIEATPLGTGGAIKQALQQCIHSQYTLVINGDTYVEYNLQNMYATLEKNKTSLVMSIKKANNTDRYGRVVIENNKITAFEEKKPGLSGFINTGVYLFSHHLKHDLPSCSIFSFEKDYLEKNAQQTDFFCSITQGYFIDIGVPADFYQAQADFSTLKQKEQHYEQ